MTHLQHRQTLRRDISRFTDPKTLDSISTSTVDRVGTIEEAAEEVPDAAVGAHGNGNESLAHRENVLDDLIAGEGDTCLLTRSTFTLELQLLAPAQTQMDFIFVSSLR